MPFLFKEYPKILIGSGFLFLLIYPTSHFLRNIQNLNLFAIASFLLWIACLTLAFLVLINSKLLIHRIWAMFNLSLSLWGLSTFWVGITRDETQAIVFWRAAHAGVLMLPALFYHLVHILANLKNKSILLFAYCAAFIFVILTLFTGLMISGVKFTFKEFYYYEATNNYKMLFSIWFCIVLLAFRELFGFIRRASGIRRLQAAYLFWGMILGFLGGTSTTLPVFGINIYPIGHFTICIYAAICTYAIFKYQLLDVRIVGTRLGIFILVYALVLGGPFGLAIWGRDLLEKTWGEGWFWVPMVALVIFATAGPFVFLYLQRKAEAILLREEQRTQDLLIQASYGMNVIHDLPKLLDLIIGVVIKTLRVNKAEIYLLNKNGGQYSLAAPESDNPGIHAFDTNNSLIQALKKNFPLIYDEIKMQSGMEDKNHVLSEVEFQMKNLSAHAIVPIAMNDSLLGFLMLGERKSKEMYTKALLDTLSVLGNQSALAIEHCYVLEAETKRLEAEGLKERMVSLDHMASSMAHEIDNPMHIIRTSLSFVKSALLRDPRVAMPEEIKQDFDESLARSLNASERVSSMIKAILDYSRMGTGKLESIRISDALEGFLQLIHPQIREEKVQFTKEIENDLPPVLGDRVQMEEVFMNFVRNSLHAVRRNEEKKISLKIFRKSETIIRVECSDNGYGIPREIINDIFLSSMTTKGSSEGTGLGLFRVRKIVDIFRGKVWAESEGKGKGATFIVELPVYEGNNTDGKE